MTKYEGNKQGKDKGVTAALWTEILRGKRIKSQPELIHQGISSSYF